MTPTANVDAKAAKASEAEAAPVALEFADLSPLLLLLAGNPLAAPN